MILPGLPLLLACAPASVPDSDPVDSVQDTAPLRVGSFNVDWLGAEYEGEFEPRNAVDYAMISQLIVEMDLDVLALQEVEGEEALGLLNLPEDYVWVVGKSGWSQNLAVVVRADRVSMENPREVSLPSSEWPSKDPLAVEISALDGGPAFTFVNVHFHPFSNAEDSEYRAQQVRELHDFLEQELPDQAQAPFDTQVVIAGDFNDTFLGINPEVDSLEVFEQDPGYAFATGDTQDYTQIPYRSQIDHILLSMAIYPQYVNAGEEGACQVVAHDKTSPYQDYAGGYGDTQNISTHRPLYIELDVDWGE